MLREGARPEIVRDNLGHANTDVTQIVYSKSWWEERVDAVSQAVEAVTMPLEMPRKEEKRINLNGRRQCFLIWGAAAQTSSIEWFVGRTPVSLAYSLLA